MSVLIITDIKYSRLTPGQDIITAVIAERESEDFAALLTQAKEHCRALEILESNIAEEAFPDASINKGDLFLKMRAPSGHGLNVGDELGMDKL
jgi:uncharacterized protein involved in propanediol utilization